jgi:predicted thioesterase
MDFETILKPGLQGRAETLVSEKNTAKGYGSGGLEVYSTPNMVTIMEGACVEAVHKFMPPGFSSVGTEVNVKHLAASPLGMKVWAEAELLEIDGRALRFRVEAFDTAGKIGEGTHSRFIVEDEKFLKKAESKV